MILARFLLLFTVVVWGWSFVATKICLNYMTPLELIGLRLLIALPVMAVIMRIRRINLRFTSHRRALALGSIIIGLHVFIQITGINYTTATNTGWIIAVTPLVMAVAAFLILKEKITRRAILGIVVATAGILLLVSRGNLGNLGWLTSIGDWLVLASAHTWALYTVATKTVTRTHSSLAVTFAVFLPVAVVACGSIIFISDWSALLHLPLEAILALLFLGLFCTALAHWFWQKGVARVGAAEAGIFLYLEPLATTTLAVPYLNESFGLFTGLGGGLVLLGVWFAQRRR